ncbi:MAG: hypothetical protein EB038_02990 [Cyclobacteriaceae bacterium]|nr:hypothetical protein [Cyclobacteriaceae bacterium]
MKILPLLLPLLLLRFSSLAQSSHEQLVELDKGWDGTFSGKPCQEDTYVYVIKTEDFDGNQKQFSGHIFLIR